MSFGKLIKVAQSHLNELKYTENIVFIMFLILPFPKEDISNSTSETGTLTMSSKYI